MPRRCEPRAFTRRRLCDINERRKVVIRKIAIIARLNEGAELQAAELLAQGPPYDPAGRGLVAHTVYLSAGEVVFAFEGPDVDVVLDEMIDNLFEPVIGAALEKWRPLIEGRPRIARAHFDWQATKEEADGSI